MQSTFFQALGKPPSDQPTNQSSKTSSKNNNHPKKNMHRALGNLPPRAALRSDKSQTLTSRQPVFHITTEALIKKYQLDLLISRVCSKQLTRDCQSSSIKTAPCFQTERNWAHTSWANGRRMVIVHKVQLSNGILRSLFLLCFSLSSALIFRTTAG